MVGLLWLLPGLLRRIDMVVWDLMTDPDVIMLAAPFEWQALAAALPMMLVGLLALHHGPHSSDRWTVALCALPSLVALGGLAWFDRWLPPAIPTLGWGLGHVLWHAGRLRSTREALQRAREQAAATLRAIADAVYTVDASHRVQLMNPAAARFASWLPQPVPAHPAQQPVTQLLSAEADDLRCISDTIDACMKRQHVVVAVRPITLKLPLGERRMRVTASPIVASSDGVTPAAAPVQAGAVLVLNDVTDTVQAAERLRHEARHDALTGLPNRVMLAGRFEEALAQARAGQSNLALLFIDLDRFRRINDSLGYLHGDALLKLMAQRLRDAAGAQNLVLRWGGDEFVVLQGSGADAHTAGALAERLVNAVAQVVAIDGLDLHCSCSIGIALAPQQADTLDATLTLADLGMRRARLHGGGHYDHGTPAATTPASSPPWTRDVLTLEARLRRALALGELELHYQPQLDIASNEPVGLEALLRWRQADGVVWSPGQFLEVAEESGLILDIGAWAISETTRQLGRWRRAGVPLLPVSINVSARQCLDRRLVQLVSEALAAEDVPASLIKLEITETTAMADVEQVMGLLAELRALGVGVAVDDFGTGYSSLAHLQRLTIDQIKIDQSFVRNIANDRQGAAIVRATIALAHELGVPVVAEGVEDQAQLTFLALHHCDIAQGYLYARPLTGTAAGDFLLDARRTPTPQPALGLA